MQIAGHKCKVCERNIALISEGKFCARCGTCVHLACLPQAQCEVCGQPFQFEERPKPDPLSDAILPPALRPAKSSYQMLLVLLPLAVFLILILIYYNFLRGIEQRGGY
jgi:hypothetical protein